MNPPADEARLRELLGYWQPLLRLQDWEITLEVADGLAWARAGLSPHTVGTCRQNDAHGWAQIRLLRAADIPEHIVPACLDLEQTLVHELLHLLIPVAPAGADAVGELSINKIAGALVRQRRLQ